MTTVSSQRVWSAKKGSRILAEKDAERVVSFMDARFPNEDEIVTAEAFVEQAKGSEIEDLLTWDDSEAGKKWRENEARHIMAAVTYQIVTGNGEPKVEEHRAYLVVSNGAKKGYVRAQVAWREPNYVEQLLDAAERELVAFQKKYEEFGDITSAIEEHVLPAVRKRKES